MKWLCALLAGGGLVLNLVGCNLPTGVGFNATSATDPKAPKRELVVFAAASLTDAMDDLGVAFGANRPGVTVVANYAGSSSLAAQLLEGAQADLFASANQVQMGAVVRADLAAAAPQIFAVNQLVVIAPADNPAAIAAFADLAQPDLRLVLALPGVPVRDYADALLADLAQDPAFGADFTAAIDANLVSEEANVRQVVAKVILGEADAGIVYASDITPEIAEALLQIPLPAAHTIPATYHLTVLSSAQESELAREFMDFILSDEGQAILQRWGFEPRPE